MAHVVFVFGTLKRGYANHAEGMRTARFLGECRTLERYPLYVADRWYVPVLLAEPGTGYHIKGELYEVDSATLAELDEIESVHLPNGYRRDMIEVELSLTGERFRSFVYLKDRSQISVFHTNMLSVYRDERYVHPRDRTQ